jgi:hypothetical protein
MVVAVLILLLLYAVPIYAIYGTTIAFLFTPIARATCFRAVDHSFQIDGRLDEWSWGKAEALPFVMSADPLDALDSYRGSLEAKWCWDDEYWYIAFIFRTPDVNAPKGKKDWRCWREDVVEILIDPNGDTVDYGGVEIAPRGYIMDYVAPGGYFLWKNRSPGKVNKSWDFREMRVGIHIDGTVDNRRDKDAGWVCEIAIPWLELAGIPGGGKPTSNTVWRVNLLANDFLPPRGRQYIELMWSQCYDIHRPTYQFHVPRRFGEVTFSTEPLQ